MAKNLEEVSVSDDELELETETAGGETPGDVPPKKTSRGTVPPGGGGRGDRSRGATTTPGFVTRLTQFLRDTRAEMRRVSWPTAIEVRNTTIITLVAVVFFALYLFGIDRVWAFLIERLRVLMGG